MMQKLDWKGLTALPRSTDSPRDIPGPSVGDDEDEISRLSALTLRILAQLKDGTIS
jgi:hypothetical protein